MAQGVHTDVTDPDEDLLLIGATCFSACLSGVESACEIFLIGLDKPDPDMGLCITRIQPQGEFDSRPHRHST